MKILPVVLLISFLALTSAQKDPHYVNGRTTIVHLMEWKWLDIANECENFLGPRGYAAVQVSPANENVIVTEPMRPWYERYQPISYELTTRSGNVSDFLEMTTRCNAAGVRIFVDVLLNHMSADHDPAIGTGGNVAFPEDKNYPAVPYTEENFHPTCDITDWANVSQIRYCELVGLHDLNQAQDHVREKLLGLLDHLVDLGVAGFRVDAAKHMEPSDLLYIYSNVKDLNPDFGFEAGSRPFIYQEVIDYGFDVISKYEYTPLGVVTEFKAGPELTKCFRGENELRWLATWGPGWGLTNVSSDALVFVDNHDTQRDGHVLTYKDGKLYRMATAFLLAYPYGVARIMSSYAFDNRDQGPPHDEDYNILGPDINVDGSCGNGWVCEHRWNAMYGMAGFRNTATNALVEEWWDDGANQIAFCRGSVGFIAMTLNSDLRANLKTCLPAGTYCDVITGEVTENGCSGRSIVVAADGTADISIDGTDINGVVAIHVNAAL